MIYSGYVVPHASGKIRPFPDNGLAAATVNR